MKKLLSPSGLAVALGVSESTVRRWCDSGQLPITRTGGGHRKIRREDAIRFTRRMGLPVLRPDLLSLSLHARNQEEGPDQATRLCEALINGDATLAISLIESLYLAGRSVAEICDDPLRAVMHRLATVSPDEKRAIFLEHRATSIGIRILNQLRSHLPKRAPGAPVALGGAPSDDPFILPSTVAALVLAEIGFSEVNLGPDTPLDVIDVSAREMNAKLVWLSLTAPRPKKVTEREVGELASRLARRGTQLVLGGQSARKYSFAPKRMLQVLDSMQELSGFARGILASEPNGKRPRSRKC